VCQCLLRRSVPGPRVCRSESFLKIPDDSFVMRVYSTYFLIMILNLLIKVFGDFLIVGTCFAIVLLNCTFILAINVIYFPLSCAHFTLKFVCVKRSHLLNSLSPATILRQRHRVLRHEHGESVSSHHLPIPSGCPPAYTYRTDMSRLGLPNLHSVKPSDLHY